MLQSSKARMRVGFFIPREIWLMRDTQRIRFFSRWCSRRDCADGVKDYDGFDRIQIVTGGVFRPVPFILHLQRPMVVVGINDIVQISFDLENVFLVGPFIIRESS
jgi:hypothetical protein